MDGVGGDNATGKFRELPSYSMFGLIEAVWNKGNWELPLYLVIFFTAFLGNIAVLTSLSRKGHKKTITNVFFFNLAMSDLILAMFCMPFSLIENLLQDFIFQEWLCKFIRFVEGASVASSVWTLVALSVERYYVICHPIRSRQWQTLSHARRIILTIWIGGILFSVPVAMLHEIKITPNGRRCTKNWLIDGFPSTLIDIVMFFIPLTIMGVTYHFISKTLNMTESRIKIGQPEPSATGIQETSLTENIEKPEEGFLKKCETKTLKLFKGQQKAGPDSKNRSAETSTIELRQTNLEQSLSKKRKVMRTINMVVLQFFICWTPLYVINNVLLYYPQLFDSDFGHVIVSCCQLLGYASGCCNPITYCFMNRCCRKWLTNPFTRLWKK